MPESFHQFKAGIYAALRDKILERIEAERDNISNTLFGAENQESEELQTQSNADQN